MHSLITAPAQKVILAKKEREKHRCCRVSNKWLRQTL